MLFVDMWGGCGLKPLVSCRADSLCFDSYHREYFQLQRKMVQDGSPQQLVFTVPIFEPLPNQYWVRAVSDRWLGAEVACPVDFRHLMLPERCVVFRHRFAVVNSM